MSQSKWITPFTKQCFVTMGVILNMAVFGAVIGYTTALLPQLKAPGSSVKVDDSSGSWIAAVIGIAMIPTHFLAPLMMGKFGRKLTNTISVVPVIIGWLVIASADSATAILVGRIIQGLPLGVTMTLGSALIGEYSSPKNRGMFLSTTSLAIGGGVFGSHIIGLYLHWQRSAFICAVLSFGDLIIVLYSPESPSWLIDQGRYQEGENAFRWLRGDSEEEELMKMIEVHKAVKNSTFLRNMSLRKRLKDTALYCKESITKKEFYKPIIILVHMVAIAHWSGIHALAGYAVDVVEYIVGTGPNVSFIILSYSFQRLIANTIFTYVVKKIKRRTLLVASSTTTVTALLLTAAYTYLKHSNMLYYDHIFIGIFLLHLHMFSLASGPLLLTYILGGELFPIEYRSFSSAIALLSASPHFVISVKTFPLLLKNMGLYGCYVLYAAFVSYCTVVIYALMPETKDRTLQDIEDEFRGSKIPINDSKAMQRLTSSIIELKRISPVEFAARFKYMTRHRSKLIM